MKSPLMRLLVVTVVMMVSSMTLLKKKVRKSKMDLTCPNCNREIMFDDEFTNFDDGGDCITATATYVCPECGEVMTVRAYFVWDGNLEVE
jgi:predicted RNA-binding Zn-ribbon protein involved in translation (DUF1610 family)